MTTPNFFYFEVTDTFGGETNYAWVRRYKVKAKTWTGAIRKVNKEEGYRRLKKVLDTGDFVRWDVHRAAICIMGSWWDEAAHQYTTHKVI